MARARAMPDLGSQESMGSWRGRDVIRGDSGTEGDLDDPAVVVHDRGGQLQLLLVPEQPGDKHCNRFISQI